MNRMTKLLTLGVAGIIILSGSTQVFALCSNPQGAQHFGGHIINCPDARPVAGFIGVVGSSPAIDSVGVDVICEDGAAINQQSVQCQGEAGIIGDGIVTISFDWSNQPGPAGAVCPNPAGVPGVGRNYFEVVCNNGASVFATVGYDVGFAAYPVDDSHPFNPADQTFDMPASTSAGGLKLASFTRAGGSDTACIDQTVLPHLYSDCDPTSAYAAFGLFCVDTTPTIAAGTNIYGKFGPCSQLPTDLRVAAWTQQTTTPSGASRCVNYPTPTAGNCAWFGTTAVIGGLDTNAIAGWIEVHDPAAATDKVKINSAAFNQGKLAVNFSTENEALTVGFNVYAGSTKLNTGLIAAKGTGSNAYSFEVGRGAVKSNKTVTVEAVKSDGSVVKTDPANVK